MRLRRVLVVVIASALCTGALVYWLLVLMVSPGQVVIAVRDVPERAGLTADMVTVVKLPRAGIHPGAARTTAAVVGQAVMYPLLAGEQVLTGKLVDGILAGRISAQLELGERAMLIPTSADRAVGGAIAVRDRIDVIFVPASNGLSAVTPRIVLTDVEVLDVRVARAGLVGPGQGEGVIVRVSPVAAESLAYAISSGDVYLALTSANPVAAAVGALPGNGGGDR